MHADPSIIQSVGIVVFDGANVLLVRHGKSAQHFEGVLGLPSGKIEGGESTIRAAQRELAEETGLVCLVEDLHQLPTAYRATIEQKSGYKTFDWYVFLCSRYSGTIQGSDETAPFWVSIDSLSSLQLLPNVADAVNQAIRFSTA